MGKLYSVVLLCVLAFLCACCFAGVNCDSHHAPAPSVDCSTLIYSMADCLSFVTNGSKVTKPEGGCCSGLKTVLKTDAECLCEAFKSSAQLGVALNETKAAGLPAACKIKAPSVSKCGLSGLSGATSPALPPKSSAPSPISGAGGRAPISGVVPAPAGAPGALPTGSSGALAPTPAASAASTASISFVVFATMLAASYFSLQFIISY